MGQTTPYKITSPNMQMHATATTEDGKSLERLSAEAQDQARLYCQPAVQTKKQKGTLAHSADDRSHLLGMRLPGSDLLSTAASNLSCSERGSLQVNLIIIDNVKAAKVSVREFLVSTSGVSAPINHKTTGPWCREALGDDSWAWRECHFQLVRHAMDC